MKKPGVLLVTGITAMFAVGMRSSAARADEPPLLVVVEIGAGADCEPVAVREAIHAELGTVVVAPGDLTYAQAPAKTLIVTLDRARISVARRDGDAWAARGIAAPADRTARLQAIAWLAGNLARDQTTAIVGAAAAPPAVTPKLPAPPTAAPAQPPSPAPAVAAVATAAIQAPPPSGAARWSVTVAGGPQVAAPYSLGPYDHSVAYHAAWLLEVQRASATGLLLGVAAETSARRQGYGGAAFAGYARRGGAWTLEANLGLGLERAHVATPIEVEPAQVVAVWPSDARMDSQWAVYGRAAGGVGYALSPTLDLMGRAGAHLSSGGRYLDSVSALLGVRLSL